MVTSKLCRTVAQEADVGRNPGTRRGLWDARPISALAAACARPPAARPTLGRGGMGEVYEGYDPHLKRTVAVKILAHRTPEDIRRFVREAQAQAAQTHADVCPVYEAGETSGRPYIVMKLIDGVSLDEASAGWPLEGKLGILRRIAEAIHAAHRTGLVHRDLKPGNLLVELTADGEAKPWVLEIREIRTPCPDASSGRSALSPIRRGSEWQAIVRAATSRPPVRPRSVPGFLVVADSQGMVFETLCL